jgi:hypothetical protein
MTESEFWWNLRIRIMSGVPGSREPLPGYCDWFEPKKYVLDGDAPRITGTVGFLPGGRSAVKLTFTLFLAHSVACCDEIDWAKLLPPDDVGDWITYSSDGSHMEIRPCRYDG